MAATPETVLAIPQRPSGAPPPASGPLGRLRRALGVVRRHAAASAHGRTSPARRVEQLPGQVRRQPPPVVALTFDDGPDPRITPALLDVLDAEGVLAAFFMCGRNAERHPRVVRAVAEAGHLVGGHTWDHRPLRRLTDADWHQQIERTHDLLEQLSGIPVRYVRAPYGILDAAARRRLRAAGLTAVDGSAGGRDWIETDPEVIAGHIARRLQPGAIVVLHDACGDLLRPGGRLPPGVHADRWPTVAAVPRVIAAARAAALEPTTLPALR